MKKTNKLNTKKATPAPIGAGGVYTPPVNPQNVSPKETEEQKQARVDAANKALKALCEKFHVVFHVPTLDISSGKIWPRIKLLAVDLPQP